MNIDKIKWCVERAEGCRLQFDGLVYLLWVDDVNTTLTTSYYSSVFYPHLLTRTIEGINRHWLEGGIYHIVQGKSYVSVYTLGSSDIQKYSMNEPDKAKQSAIDYVYEQEQSNERFN